jgi:hypothetical protein
MSRSVTLAPPLCVQGAEQAEHIAAENHANHVSNHVSTITHVNTIEHVNMDNFGSKAESKHTATDGSDGGGPEANILNENPNNGSDGAGPEANILNENPNPNPNMNVAATHYDDSATNAGTPTNPNMNVAATQSATNAGTPTIISIKPSPPEAATEIATSVATGPAAKIATDIATGSETETATNPNGHIPMHLTNATDATKAPNSKHLSLPEGRIRGNSEYVFSPENRKMYRKSGTPAPDGEKRDK